jgi:hypothetical protein
MAERGFLVVAMGERQNKAAAVAIAGLRARGHALPVALITDGTGRGMGADQTERVNAEPHGCRNLPAFLPRSPFAETLFIAHDMVAVGRLEPVFELLADRDLALAHAVATPDVDDPLVPPAFRGFDPGVIAWRATPTILAWFAAWHAALVEGHERDPDDPAWHAPHAGLRRALWQGRLSVTVLPAEYNYRAGTPGFLRGKVVLLHSPHRPAAEVAQELNLGDGPRVFGAFMRREALAGPLGGFATAARYAV